MYNVADDDPIGSIEFVNWIANILEKKASIFKLPKGILDLVAKMGNIFNWDFNSKNLYEKSHSRVVNCDKLKNELQITKMPFDTEYNVIKTIEYYNSIKI